MGTLGVGQFFTSRHSGTSCKYLLLRQHIIWARMTYRHCQLMTSRLPGSLKQTRGSGACHGNLTTLNGFVWGAFCGHDSSTVNWFYPIMQSSFYNLKTYSRSRTSGHYMWATYQLRPLCMVAFQRVGGSSGWLDLNLVQIRHFWNRAVKQTVRN